MGKLVVTEFVSLDGVMEAPGGEVTAQTDGVSCPGGARVAAR